MSAPDPTGLGEDLKRAADAATPRPVDVDAVLAASRSRRRARRTAVVTGAGAVAAVLVVGGLVFGLQRPGGGATTADAPVVSESAGSAETAPEIAGGESADDAAGIRLAAPEALNSCGAPVVEATDAAGSPLAATVAVPDGAVPPGATRPVTVTVTNPGTEPVTGALSSVPAITVADGGVTVWHTSGTSDPGSRPVALAPGESLTLTGEVTASRCDAEDEQGGPLPADLPPLGSGHHAIGAVLWFTSADGTVSYVMAPYTSFTVG
jgi:hypothetical protein